MIRVWAVTRTQLVLLSLRVQAVTAIQVKGHESGLGLLDNYLRVECDTRSSAVPSDCIMRAVASAGARRELETGSTRKSTEYSSF
eukprot:6175406-Pleurochrysis_carterae.AAC.1